MKSSTYSRGIELFNHGEFFDAHEVLEDIWRESAGPEKKFLQGLIQVAVALHHHSTGNLRGARSLMDRAGRNLEPYPDQFYGIELGQLRIALAAWQEAMALGAEVPPQPRVRCIDDESAG